MEDNRRPPATMRGHSPCMGCQDRHTACHDKCERHKEWKGEADRQKKAQKEYMDMYTRRSWLLWKGQ